ncbi:MAG: PhnD/SsuA/transferrin family substrate-binding protein [Pseudomonadota bacterium]|nr:PhnD/SsuA/transferrin family substrate-binding protein [Pseudomonadota bacterium]
MFRIRLLNVLYPLPPAREGRYGISRMPRHGRSRYAILLLCCALATMVRGADLEIGVLAYQGPERAIQRWQATADYLSAVIPGHRFHIRPLDLDSIQRRTASGGLDFVLTNPGHYVVLETRFGVSRIATLVGLGTGPERDRFASVVFSRRDGPVETLHELGRHRFAAVAPDAFGGFQLAWWTLRQEGVDLMGQPDKLVWTGFPQREIVRAVLSGRADAGTVRTGVLETMAAEGEISLDLLHILGARVTRGFPYLHSTELVPQWPFGKLPGTPEDLARSVAIALLELEPESPASLAAGVSGWTIPSDYSTVHTILRDLQVGPYRPAPLTLDRLLAEYGSLMAISVAALLAVVGFALFTLGMNRRLTHSRESLQVEVAQRRLAQADLARHRDELEQRVAERTRELHEAAEERQLRQAELTHVARVAAAGELVGGLAHELNQPLTAAGTPAPLIEISITSTGRRQRLCVEDNGPGLPEGMSREHLMDSFYTTRENGLGMGLSISRSLVESHGGELTLADAPGGGARICLELPEVT